MLIPPKSFGTRLLSTARMVKHQEVSAAAQVEAMPLQLKTAQLCQGRISRKLSVLLLVITLKDSGGAVNSLSFNAAHLESAHALSQLGNYLTSAKRMAVSTSRPDSLTRVVRHVST